MSILDGVTRSPSALSAQKYNEMVDAIENPTIHNPVKMANRIKMRVVGPDGVIKQEVDKVENLMCSFGLNRLCELVATGGDASNWISAYRIGTGTTAAATNNDALVASTGSVALSAASMNLSDAGARTLRYLATFASNNPAGAAAIHEVGLFCNSTANSQAAARAVLGTDSVNKGASDQIQISHDIIFNASTS